MQKQAKNGKLALLRQFHFFNANLRVGKPTPTRKICYIVQNTFYLHFFVLNFEFGSWEFEKIVKHSL
jgi:hypothetical protein